MKIIAAIITATVFIYSCGNAGEEEKSAAVPAEDTTAVSSPIQYREVIAEAYMGVVPCADCEGIKTEVTLYADTTFQLVTNYLGKNPKDTAGLNITKRGRYTMNNDTLRLDEDRFRFLKNDTSLVQLDGSGKIITGKLADRFILKKVKL